MPQIQFKETVVPVPQVVIVEVVKHVPKVFVQEVIKQVPKIVFQEVVKPVYTGDSSSSSSTMPASTAMPKAGVAAPTCAMGKTLSAALSPLVHARNFASQRRTAYSPGRDRQQKIACRRPDLPSEITSAKKNV